MFFKQQQQQHFDVAFITTNTIRTNIKTKLNAWKDIRNFRVDICLNKVAGVMSRFSRQNSRNSIITVELIQFIIQYRAKESKKRCVFYVYVYICLLHMYACKHSNNFNKKKKKKEKIKVIQAYPF